jgi:hypothetical protein
MSTYTPRSYKKNKSPNINVPYTYLISDGTYYKIGKSMNPFRRLQQLKTANPLCELIAYTKKYTEKQLHKKFRRWKLDREWYNLPQYEVQNLIIEMTEPKKKKSVIEIKNIQLQEYLIPYGDYKGRKLCSMLGVDEIRYLRKQLKELPRLCEEWAMFMRWCNHAAINELVK